MPATIVRQVLSPKKLTIAVNESDTDDVDVSGGEFGMVFVPLGWGTADITFLASSQSNAYSLDKSIDTPGAKIEPTPPFDPVADDTGALFRITGIVPGRWYTFPLRVLRMKYLRLRSTLVGAATASPQANVQTLLLVLKT